MDINFKSVLIFTLITSLSLCLTHVLNNKVCCNNRENPITFCYIIQVLLLFSMICITFSSIAILIGNLLNLNCTTYGADETSWVFYNECTAVIDIIYMGLLILLSIFSMFISSIIVIVIFKCTCGRVKRIAKYFANPNKRYQSFNDIDNNVQVPV